jgi:predicted dithiol-disulfide oxidoreductase (DUF899 family)
MPETAVPHPEIVSEAEWRKARLAHLEREKAVTKELDRLRAERRRLPMTPVTKPYVFDGPNGKVSLKDLFADRRQLVIYHFMFDPAWSKGCPGCTGYVDAIGDLSMLNQRNTTFAVVSRAPLEKLQAYKAAKGWDIDWYSSFGSDFNYDFHVTLDEKVAPIEYNYRSLEELKKRHGPNGMKGEEHGLSVFFRLGDDVYHTYSAYARGTESLTDSYQILDVTAYGRQEDFEDSPVGWPQKPTYG